RRLWAAVDRPNLMVKVPGTDQGVPAIRQLIGEGINVNVTLLFGLQRYEEVAEAYIAGLEHYTGDAHRVSSVASFFVSRVDTAVDARIEQRLKAARTDAERAELESLLGKVAIANARLAYQRYKELFSGPRWQALGARGARSQRLLWASTSTKNPKYPDVMYIEELIGPDTVNTVPPATLDAYRDHGRPRLSLAEDVAGAQATIDRLKHAGIELDEVTDELIEEGVRLFADSFDKLLAAVARQRDAAIGGCIDRQTYTLPADLAAEVKTTLEEWRVGGKMRRLWQRDASLWTGAD